MAQMEIDELPCPGCQIIQFYLDMWRDDFRCPYCAKLWPVPNSNSTSDEEETDGALANLNNADQLNPALASASRRRPSNSPPPIQDLTPLASYSGNKAGNEPKVLLCPNDWCTYKVEITEKRSEKQANHYLANHSLNCEKNYDKGRRFKKLVQKGRNGRLGGTFVPISDKERAFQEATESMEKESIEAGNVPVVTKTEMLGLD